MFPLSSSWTPRFTQPCLIASARGSLERQAVGHARSLSPSQKTSHDLKTIKLPSFLENNYSAVYTAFISYFTVAEWGAHKSSSGLGSRVWRLFQAQREPCALRAANPPGELTAKSACAPPRRKYRTKSKKVTGKLTEEKVRQRHLLRSFLTPAKDRAPRPSVGIRPPPNNAALRILSSQLWPCGAEGDEKCYGGRGAVTGRRQSHRTMMTQLPAQP